MKRITLLCCLALTFNSQAIFGLFEDNLADCPGITEGGRKSISSVDNGEFEDLAKTKDIESTAKLYIQLYKTFCEDDSYIKKATAKLNKIKKESWKNAAKRFAADIERVSEYKVPEKEWEKLLEYSKKLNIDPYTYISKTDKETFFNNGLNNQLINKSKCSNIDNRKAPIKGAVRDQDGIGWCYAFTAADLLSYKLNKTVSAFDIANTYNQGVVGWVSKNIGKNRESDLEGGHTHSAIKGAINKGLCLEKDIRSSDFKFAKMGQLSTEIKKLEKFKDQFDKSTKINGHYSAQGSRKNAKKRLEQRKKARIKKINEFFSDCSKLNEASWRNLFPGITNKQIVDVLLKTANSEIVNEMINEGCRTNRLNAGKLEIESTNLLFSSDEKKLKVIDEQLEKNNIVAIAYKSSILRDPYSEKSGAHASSIVARRFNSKTQSCDYLVRNSWGEGCSSYYKSYQCESGNVWIPKNQIAKGIMNVTYIK